MPVYSPPSERIRVAIARNPPDAFNTCRHFPTFEETIECMFPGWCLEVLSMITASMNVTIEEVKMPYMVGSVDWGTLQSNGKWSGTLAFLQNDTVDTICLMFPKTDARARDFTFANTIISVRPIYVTKQNPESYASLAANVHRSFNLELWMFMIAMTLLMMITFLIIARVQSKIFDTDYWSPFRIVWMLYEYFVDQENDNHYPEPPRKITLTVWALCQCVIMSSLYRGVLLSQLLNPIETKPFSSADEMITLIAKKEYKLTTNYLGNWYFDELQRSGDSHYARLRAATKDNPVVLANSVQSALDLVESGGYIYPIQEDSTAMQLAKQRCNLVFFSEGLPEKTAHFIFAKNSSWLKSWNEQIVLTQQFQWRTFRLVILNAQLVIVSKYFEDGFYPSGTPPKCPDIYNNRKAGDALDIFSILGILAMWMIGIILSVVVLVGEKIVRYRRQLFKHRLLGASPIFRSVPSSASSRTQMITTF